MCMKTHCCPVLFCFVFIFFDPRDCIVLKNTICPSGAPHGNLPRTINFIQQFVCTIRWKFLLIRWMGSNIVLFVNVSWQKNKKILSPVRDWIEFRVPTFFSFLAEDAVGCSLWGLCRLAGELQCSRGQWQGDLEVCDCEEEPPQSEFEQCSIVGLLCSSWVVPVQT